MQVTAWIRLAGVGQRPGMAGPASWPGLLAAAPHETDTQHRDKPRDTQARMHTHTRDMHRDIQARMHRDTQTHNTETQRHTSIQHTHTTQRHRHTTMQAHTHTDTQHRNTHTHTDSHKHTRRPHEELNNLRECAGSPRAPSTERHPFPGRGSHPSTRRPPPGAWYSCRFQTGPEAQGADRQAPGPGTSAPTAPALRPNPPRYCQGSKPVRDQNLCHTRRTSRKHPRCHSQFRANRKRLRDQADRSPSHTGPDTQVGAALGQVVWVGSGPTVHAVTHDKTRRPALVMGWWED